MKRAIVLYLHVHQPYRVREYSLFDTGVSHDYFSEGADKLTNNASLMRKVAAKSYLPTNQRLKKLLDTHPQFKVSLSITGTAVEQMAAWAPEALHSFKELAASDRVEIVAETYHHSLAFFYSRPEFERQVALHHEMVAREFGQTPKVFRNTELAYNNDLAYWADKQGYQAVLAEGWDKVLGWRNANYVYQPAYTEHIRLLMKNYRLSDDIAFRFGDHKWVQWPLTAEKFVNWLGQDQNATNYNLFMDYETFGEHQWSDSGIFDFLEAMPAQWLKHPDHTFMTVCEAANAFEPVDTVDVPQTITWADTERDLSAWLGNNMQQQAIHALYELAPQILDSADESLMRDWRRLQTSDHFYYMCTKWFNDGDIHAYFSPYASPYDGFISYMNVWHDLRARLSQNEGVA